ncbi:hypothetical protein F4678DRAFT_109243 [Xylaria arbuscula]|nr:hypothetical protein F4678DRAFT_109243 [Xylaria arbuscula]
MMRTINEHSRTNKTCKTEKVDGIFGTDDLTLHEIPAFPSLNRLVDELALYSYGIVLGVSVTSLRYFAFYFVSFLSDADYLPGCPCKKYTSRSRIIGYAHYSYRPLVSLIRFGLLAPMARWHPPKLDSNYSIRTHNQLMQRANLSMAMQCTVRTGAATTTFTMLQPIP